MAARTTLSMSCRFCKEEKILRNSHIIPEFIYKPLYDEKHRFNVLSNLGAKRPPKLQKGVRERLLCTDCEGHISQFEQYASHVFSGRAGVTASRQGNFVQLDGLDYRKLKLFALSVLWRAGVSSLGFFGKVSLGVHEPRIRRMILEGDPGLPSDYPFVMSLVVFENIVQTDIIMQPTWTRANGHRGYRFVFGGIAWIYIVSSHSLPIEARTAALSDNGKISMLISDMRNIPFIVEWAKEWGSGKSQIREPC